MCHGSGSQPAEGRWPYDVESSDSFTVCYVVTSNVVRDDVHRYRSCGVSGERYSRLVYGSKGAAGGQVYMVAMGLWRPQTGLGDPGPVPASSCNTCMKCQYCFPGGRPPPE